jgi:hypothetical protein
VQNKLRWACLLYIAFAGCSAPDEPVVTPPQPHFVERTAPPNPIDRGIYADVDPTLDAIVIEWKPDSTGTTTGYLLYRAIGDSTVGTDGLLTNRVMIARFESSNSLVESLPTSYRDTAGIAPGGVFWYQLQAFHRSPTGKVTYSTPTHVDFATSFSYEQRDILLSPNSQYDTLHGLPLKFIWQAPGQAGAYQIIVQRMDNLKYVWSSGVLHLFDSTPAVEYPPTADSLLPNISYRWRVKRWTQYGGSTSPWITFGVVP